jgi:exosortase B
VLGTALDIVNFQLLSQLLVLAGLILLMRGRAALRVMAFPLLFLLFMFPIPPFIIDALTQPLKGWVSWAADQILYSAGYPIARQGVMLTIGQYQLLVADACSGLRSLVSLGALAVLYIHISARTSLLHRGLMVASIVPLALIANLVRVIALVLITYYLGDAAGQGFLHGAAGMVLFLVAMLCLIGWDQLLSRLLPHAKPAA